MFLKYLLYMEDGCFVGVFLRGAVRCHIYTCSSSTTLTSSAPDHPSIRMLDTIPLPSLDPRFHRKLVTPNHPKSTIDLLGKNFFWIWFFLSNSDAICWYLKMESHTLECFCWMLWSPTCRRQSTTWCTSKSLRHLPSWLPEAYSCLMTVPEFLSNHWRSEGKPIQCLGKQNMK